MKKNRKLITIFVLIDVMVLLICIFLYNRLTSDVKTEEQKKPEVIEREVIIETSSYPKVDAVSNMQDLANAFMKNFTGEDIDTSKIKYSEDGKLYKRLVDGSVDLVIAKEPSKEELDYASQSGVEIEYSPLVIDAFVFYVNHDNPVYNLSLDEIRKIYSEKIDKWTEVGGNGDTIRAFQRNADSENQKGMIDLVMDGTEMSSPILEEKSNTEEISNDIVADFDNGIDSLGYSYYSYAKKLYDEYGDQIIDGIKFLKVNDVKPSYDNIRNNTYPLKTIYYVAIRKGADASATKLKNAMLSSRGKAVAKEAGYVGTK